MEDGGGRGGEGEVTSLILAQVWGSTEKGELGREGPFQRVRAPFPSTEDDVQSEPGANKEGGPCLSSQPLESEARGL